jgi:RNA polymerase sigma-70 factor (ECF subfamily)
MISDGIMPGPVCQPSDTPRVAIQSHPREEHPLWLSDTLPRAAAHNLNRSQAGEQEITLDRTRALEQFLASVEKRAFQIARIAVRDADDALDIVQDAMLQLARRYADRSAEEWKPLFYRILQNRIRDCQRRRQVRNRVLAWWPGARKDDEPEDDPIERVADGGPIPVEQVKTAEAMQALEAALAELPARQQEAFLLRTLEGLDVAETATAMGCSEGSVKTHYSRAVHTLRARLGDVW